MTLALTYQPSGLMAEIFDQQAGSVPERVDFPQLFSILAPSILGRLYSPANSATSNIEVAFQINGTELRTATRTLARTDVEDALNLCDAMPVETESGWDTNDDVIVPFAPKWSVKVTATFHFRGRLAPEDIDIDEDYVD